MIRQESRQVDIQSHIQKAGNLPTIPEVLVHLLDKCDSDAADITALTELISLDPAISFGVMQLANSSYFNQSNSFTGLHYALEHIGLKSIKSIIFTAAINQVFERKRINRVKQFSICSFWFHSVLSAVISRRIARMIGYQNVEEAYIAGLFHDIGRLVLVGAFPKEHETILLETDKAQNIIWSEKQLLGVTHNTVGAQLVRRWGQRSFLADAIQYHHEPSEQVADAFPLVKIVHLANQLGESRKNNATLCRIGDEFFQLNASDLDNLLADGLAEVYAMARKIELAVEPEVKTTTGNGEENEQHSSQSRTSSSSSAVECPVSSQVKNQVALINWIKGNSLLSGFMEKIIEDGELESILVSFEQSLQILFGIDRVLLFLPDNDRKVLEGSCSTTNSLYKITHGLTLAIERSSSKIVETFLQSEGCLLHLDGQIPSMADSQLMNLIHCQSLVLLPMRVDGSTIGVVAFALPDGVEEFTGSEMKIAAKLAQQVAKNMQLEHYRTRLVEKREAERMAVVSMTAKKVAHEINNPLGIINNYLKAMSLKFSDNSELKQELTVIEEEIGRISTMVNQLGVLSPTEHLVREMVDVNDVLAGVVQLIRPSLFNEEGQTLDFFPGVDLPRVKLSQHGLKQIMVNLLKNCAEAIGDEGRVEVSTRLVVKEQHIHGASAISGIEIRIQDDGPGLPDKVKENMYKPFVTTKQGGHSGLGLSIVHKLVSELRGSLSYTSNAQDGTCFRLHFAIT